MTYGRAVTIALMVVMLDRAYPEPLGVLALVLLFYFLWMWTSDPLPDAIRKGLEAFARDYRR